MPALRTSEPEPREQAPSRRLRALREIAGAFRAAKVTLQHLDAAFIKSIDE
jgi:hypothetical protein